jgi:4-amino-4-deoxychorismate lyase
MPGHTHDDDFYIFTTLRVDSVLLSNAAHTALCGGHKSDVYLLPYHLHRLKTAAATMTEFHCPEAMSSFGSFRQYIQDAVERSDAELSEQRSSHIDAKQAIVRRGKISWWPSGRLDITLLPVPQDLPTLTPTSFDDLPVPLWSAVLDDQPTGTDLYTEIKTSHRRAYDRARKNAGLDPKSTTEVLLYNANSEVIDGSITTLYFYRNNRWVTPQCGGLEGTTRRFALENELCSIADSAVRSDSLCEGETIWLSNAFRGFFAATFRKR